MTAEVKPLIEEFEALPESAKREVLAELLRISLNIDEPAVADVELLTAANGIFAGYDAEESSD